MNSLLPPNASTLERQLETTSAQSTAIPVTGIRDIWNIDRCPKRLLPWLAWTLSVDEWNPKWEEKTQRDVIREALAIHQRKGTIGAIRAALATLDIQTEIQEWFEYGGAPHTFKLTARANEALNTSSESILDDQFYRTVRDTVNAVKPVRSHYELRVGANYQQQIQLASVINPVQVTRRSLQTQVIHVTRRLTTQLASAFSAVSVLRVRMAM